ncbi:NADPH-dependent FMN reductase [uncultured Jatrophihabitans sp.]|uniref:NADPH-dependent FMN reductase n=1 Tax=uncultured Jatrophihabitans sp. TaxID=1610747 RepID=UPI0035CB2AED
MTVAILVGNPKPLSRTFRAAERVAERLTGSPPDLAIDLADFGPALLDWKDPVVAQAVADVQAVDLLVVASPTYKATYTGLLKLFLDRFAAGSLSRVTAVALMLGGDWRHSLAPEAFLKPVLAELGASSPTRGLFLLDAEAETDWADSAALDAWLELARAQLPPALLAAGDLAGATLTSHLSRR